MTTNPTSDSTTANRSRRVRMSPTCVLLLLGPILLSVGYALHPDLPNETRSALSEVTDVRDIYIWAKLMVAFGLLLMIPLILAIRHVATPDRGRTLATVAAAMTGVGFACNALSQSLYGYLLYFASDPSVDATAAASVIDAAQGTNVVATLPVSFLSVPLFAAGLLVLATALWRANSVPRWVPLAMVLNVVAAGAFPVGPVNLATGVLVTAAFAYALNPAPSVAGHGKVKGWSSLPRP